MLRFVREYPIAVPKTCYGLYSAHQQHKGQESSMSDSQSSQYVSTAFLLKHSLVSVHPSIHPRDYFPIDTPASWVGNRHTVEELEAVNSSKLCHEIVFYIFLRQLGVIVASNSLKKWLFLFLQLTWWNWSLHFTNNILQHLKNTEMYCHIDTVLIVEVKYWSL